MPVRYKSQKKAKRRNNDGRKLQGHYFNCDLLRNLILTRFLKSFLWISNKLPHYHTRHIICKYVNKYHSIMLFAETTACTRTLGTFVIEYFCIICSFSSSKSLQHI